MPSVLQAFHAQTADGGGGAFGGMLIPLVAMFAIFYFLLIRPQQKQAKQHQTFIGALKKGDEVVTQGGIVGTVVLVEDRTVTVDVGGGTKLRILKQQIASQWKAVESQPVKAEAKK